MFSELYECQSPNREEERKTRREDERDVERNERKSIIEGRDRWNECEWRERGMKRKKRRVRTVVDIYAAAKTNTDNQIKSLF